KTQLPKLRSTSVTNAPHHQGPSLKALKFQDDVANWNFVTPIMELRPLPATLNQRALRGTPMATVLLVEDDNQVRVLAESYLEEQGHEVLSAGTAPGALALVAKTSQLDLLFTNVDLKGKIAAGIELAQEAVNRGPNLKVLYTTERNLTD